VPDKVRRRAETNRSPGTRSGFIHDAAYAALCEGLAPLEQQVVGLIEEQRRAEEEQASREQLRAIQRAFREALLALPAEEYDWFDIHARAFRAVPEGGLEASASDQPDGDDAAIAGAPEPALGEAEQRQFFAFAGPLFSVAVSPASSIVRIGQAKEIKALPRDRRRRRVERDLAFHWQIIEGAGSLTGERDQAVTYLAPEEPGLARLQVTVRQNGVACTGEGLITVTHELMAQLGSTSVPSQGLPGYTFERAPGESWRSRFDTASSSITVTATSSSLRAAKR
jgi:hypothetical protein